MRNQYQVVLSLGEAGVCQTRDAPNALAFRNVHLVLHTRALPPMNIGSPTTWLSWSSGKDSAWTLHVLRRQVDIPVVALLTTVNQKAGRVAMHAVRESLIEAQARALGLPLIKVPLPHPCSNDLYEQAMAGAVKQATEAGVTHMAFGDLYLEEIRRYRETMFEGSGLTLLFPIWGSDTSALARRMVAEGLQAVVTCVDPRQLPRSFAGRLFDETFLEDLPSGVDPCGERGEFHTFAFGGPMFARSVPITIGETVERDGFVFTDVLPGEIA